jgi:hypothetical protein
MQAGTVRSFGSPSVINWSGGESKARRVPINMLVKIGNEQQTALCCKGPDGARLYLVGLGVNPMSLVRIYLAKSAYYEYFRLRADCYGSALFDGQGEGDG